MGGGRAKRRKTHLFEDQYGTIESSDRDIGHGQGSSGKTMGSGVPRRGGSLEYVKHVPKFLQDHAHLLGHAPGKPEPPTYSSLSSVQQQAGADASNDNDDVEEDEGLLQALEQQGPGILKEYPELAMLQNKRDAEVLKEKGNRAFKEKRYNDAVDIFTRCIELDNGNHVYHSNLAAALIELEQYDKAVDHARQCVGLNPDWAKGYVRLGIALLRQGKVESAHVLKKAKVLEPDMQGIDELLSKAIHLVQQLKKKDPCPATNNNIQEGTKRSSLLSFHDDEEEQDE